MAVVDLGISQQANAFYRTTNGARHERARSAAHAYNRKQKLSRVIRAQVESENQPDLSNKSVKSGTTPAHQVRKYSGSSNALQCKFERLHCLLQGFIATHYGASQGSVEQTTDARRRHTATAVFAALVS